MAASLRRRVVTLFAVALFVIGAGYAWKLFFTRGSLGFALVRAWVRIPLIVIT